MESLYNNETFDNIPVGSIIIANRSKYDENTKGPFVVIGKKGKQYVSLFVYRSNGAKRNIDPYDYYTLNSDLPVDENSFVAMRKCCLISEENISKTIGYLSKPEIKEIYKRMEYQMQTKHFNYFKIQPKSVPTNIGDILFYNKKRYLVLNKDNHKMLMAKYNTYTSQCYYNEVISINNDDDYQRVGSISETKLKKYLNEYKMYLINNKKAKKEEKFTTSKIKDNNSSIPLDKGFLIEYNNRLYFVYYQLGDKLFAFEVFTKCKDNYKPVIINNFTYFTTFGNRKSFNINKRDFKVIAKASDFESDIINTSKTNDYKYIKKF